MKAQHFESNLARFDRRRLARALRAAHMAWWEWDLQNDKFAVHAEGDCILGYDCHHTKFTSEFWNERVHAEDKEVVAEWIRQIREGEEEIATCEHRFLRADSERPVWEWVEEVSNVTLRDQNGRALFVEGTTRNIHERKLMEASLWLSNEYAREASRVREEFLATVSHELRNPLNAISCAAQLMGEEGGSDPASEENVQLILKSSDELRLLLDRFIDYSVAISGSLEVAIRTIPIDQLFADVFPYMEKICREHDIALEVKTSDPKPRVQVDKEKMVQVLIAIFGNAIQYSKPSGKVKVWAESRRCSKDPAYTKIYIQDHGCGMDRETLSKVFEPFFQGHLPRNRHRVGTGMGLSISREFVHAMGGEIDIESEPGWGTTVIVTLGSC